MTFFLKKHKSSEGHLPSAWPNGTAHPISGQPQCPSVGPSWAQGPDTCMMKASPQKQRPLVPGPPAHRGWLDSLSSKWSDAGEPCPEPYLGMAGLLLKLSPPSHDSLKPPTSGLRLPSGLQWPPLLTGHPPTTPRTSLGLLMKTLVLEMFMKHLSLKCSSNPARFLQAAQAAWY